MNDRDLAYPLQWPVGWRRVPARQRKRSRYEVSFARARDELLRELRLLSGRGAVISTNVELRRDGLPYANTREPGDPGVAVYWTQGGRAQSMACDQWSTVRENVRAVGLTVAALRQIERTGASQLLERAFAGFAALPAESDCWGILGIEPGAPSEAIDRAFRERARQQHPDAGGTEEEMQRLNRARQRALETGRA